MGIMVSDALGFPVVSFSVFDEETMEEIEAHYETFRRRMDAAYSQQLALFTQIGFIIEGSSSSSPSFSLKPSPQAFNPSSPFLFPFSHIDDININQIEKRPQEITKFTIRGGFPPSHRAHFWRHFAKVSESISLFGEDYYDSLVEQMQQMEEREKKVEGGGGMTGGGDLNLRQIRLDLHRTFPGHEFLHSMEGQKVRREGGWFFVCVV